MEITLGNTTIMSVGLARMFFIRQKILVKFTPKRNVLGYENVSLLSIGPLNNDPIFKFKDVQYVDFRHLCEELGIDKLNDYTYSGKVCTPEPITPKPLTH